VHEHLQGAHGAHRIRQRQSGGGDRVGLGKAGGGSWPDQAPQLCVTQGRLGGTAGGSSPWIQGL